MSVPPVIRLLSRLIRTTDLVSPRLAGRLAARLWFTPPHRRPRPVLGDISELTLTFDGRPLWAFSAGEGREIVLLVHGWGSSADRLAHFVGPLTEAGFRVVGVDLPAHGRTSGSQTDPVELAGAVRAITEQLGGVHAIVAHSMGAFATILAMADGLEPQQVVFIAPLVRVESALHTFRHALNLPPRTARELERRLKRRFGENMFSDFALDRLAKEFDTTEALIFHDPDDIEAPYQDAEALAAAWKTASLVEVSGLGHHGILRNGAVVNRTMRFISAGRPHPGRPESIPIWKRPPTPYPLERGKLRSKDQHDAQGRVDTAVYFNTRPDIHMDWWSGRRFDTRQAEKSRHQDADHTDYWESPSELSS